MTYDDLDRSIREHCAAIIADLDLYRAEQVPPVVTATPETLQSALDAGAPRIQLSPAVYPGIAIRHPVELTCTGATIAGVGVPAILIASSDVTVTDPVCASTFQCVMQIGYNDDRQTTIEQVPRRITIVRPVIASHCGPNAKNGIENNGADVLIDAPQIANVWSPSAVETHGIITLNTPGGLTVRGGSVQAASNPLFTGGDAMKIHGIAIAGIIYDGVTTTRPASWQTDGINRNVKNEIEFKNVAGARVSRCNLTNNWGPIQKGFAGMITPKVDGSVVDVEFSDNAIDRVGGGFNILGRNPLDPALPRTDDIRIRRNIITIDKNVYGPGAFGWPFLLSAGPGRILIEDNTVSHNGNSFIYVDDLTRIASLIVRGNTFNAGTYGIRTPAGNNGANWSQVFDELIVEGNTITGASSVFRANFPNNAFLA